MNPASGESVLIVDQDHPSRPVGTPLPNHEVVVVVVGSGREASDAHAHIASRDKALCEDLRCGNQTSQHFRPPSWAREFGFAYAQRPPSRSVQSIKDRFGIDLIGTKGERLHRSIQRLRLAYGCERSEGRIECGAPGPVEASSV